MEQIIHGLCTKAVMESGNGPVDAGRSFIHPLLLLYYLHAFPPPYLRATYTTAEAPQPFD